MNIMEAIGIGCLHLAIFGLICAGGLLGVQVIAWVWYRRDGGKLGLLRWLRGIRRRSAQSFPPAARCCGGSDSSAPVTSSY